MVLFRPGLDGKREVEKRDEWKNNRRGKSET